MEPERLAREVKTAVVVGDLPYEKAVYVREVMFYLDNAADAMIEAGKRLLVIQEKEGRGEFVKLVEEEIGISRTMAYRMMNSALKREKFPKIDFSHRWEKSKVYTLLEAPEEDLKELESKGVLAGNTMDELAAMTRRELTALVRELKQDREAIAKGIEKEVKAEMNALRKEIKRLSPFDPEAKGEDLNYLVAQIESVDAVLNEVDDMLRKFVVDERVLDLPEIQARIEALQTRMRNRIESFTQDWDGFVNPA